jgi:hypothetical protein
LKWATSGTIALDSRFHEVATTRNDDAVLGQFQGGTVSDPRKGAGDDVGLIRRIVALLLVIS